MNPEQLQTFLAIVKFKQISLAANSLYITQAAVSNRLRRLESQLGVQLVNRNKGQAKISLTNYGEKLVPIATQWMQLSKETDNLKNNIQYQSINVTTTSDINASFLSRICLSLMQTEVDLRFAFQETNDIDVYSNIDNDSCDIGFSFFNLPSYSIDVKPIGNESLTLIANTASVYTENTVFEELDRKYEVFIPWSPEYLDWHMIIWEDDQHPLVKLSSASSLTNFLQLEQAWALVPNSIASHLVSENHQIKRITLKNKVPSLPIYCISKKGNLKNKSFLNKFYAQVKSEHFKMTKQK